MAKENKDGWIRHRGGKCPVDADEKVDVRFSDGDTVNYVSAANLSWPHRHCHISSRIMAYRPHKTEQKAAPVSEPKGKTPMPISETGAGPIEWRDRIRQIDAEESKRNEEHRKAIEALEEERLSLVQKLESEGFKLIEDKPACDGFPAEDMSDPDNWRTGDLIEIVSNSNDHKFQIGELVRIKGVSGE